MSKRFRNRRFKGKPCAYCPDLADTGDHVLARSFFPRSEWTGLPEVPACSECNGEKSRLENYLATVLLFGGRHADAHANLVGMGERRLAGNVALHRKLQHGATRVWLKEDSGLTVRTMALPIEPERFTRYFEYVVRGLIRHEFKETIGPDDYVEVHTLTNVAGERFFRNLLARNSAAKVQRDFGQGAFTCEASQGVDNPRVSVWLLSVFGGLLFQDEHGRAFETKIGAMTGPRRINDRVELRQRWLEGRGAFAS